MKSSKKNKKRLIPALLISLVLLVIAIAISFALWRHYHHKINFIPSKTPIHSQSISVQSGTASKQNIPISTKTQTSSSSPTTTTNNTATLTTPTGTFVSNHSPGHNSSPTSEISTCVTSPGATCYIEFVSGSTTNKLESETADSNGVATWSWDVTTSQLTSGSWQISAVATLGDQTKTTTDPLPLEVQ